MKVNLQPNVAQLTPEQRQLWDSCQQLEKVFLQIMLKQMQTPLTQGALPQSFQRQTYEDMQRDTLAEQMARSGDVGLATMLFRQLNRQ